MIHAGCPVEMNPLCRPFFARASLPKRFLRGVSRRLQVMRVTLHFFNDVFRLNLALNRRSAFSRDSPSCNRISATLTLLNFVQFGSVIPLQTHNLYLQGIYPSKACNARATR
jgi:hypothetical protein